MTSLTEFTAKCHCGRVQGIFSCNSEKIIAWDCNCSDCFMRANVHLIIPQEDFRLDMAETMEAATILYQWGTKTAIRQFCRTCGVLPWYRPRSNPDGVGINIRCVDWTKGGTRTPPTIVLEKFDGINYEESLQKANDPNSKVIISMLSKKS